MQNIKILLVFLLLGVIPTSLSIAQTKQSPEDEIQTLVSILKTEGEDPAQYVLGKVQSHSLVIFDDAMHNLAEPWDFYQALIQNPEFVENLNYIFIEIIPLNKQPNLDAYFNAPNNNQELLYPAFQSGTGWQYKIYFDLFNAIYEVNKNLPPERRVKVIAVSTPSYWSAIKTSEDVQNYYQNDPLARDYLMYQLIKNKLDDFQGNKKGIFLTNTRHSYIGLKRKDGTNFWNAGTFFRQWHPGKTFSIRFHAPLLEVRENKSLSDNDATTREGLEKFEIKWVRPAKGLWDEAITVFGKTVAIDLEKNPFGDHPYIGNLMLNALPGQTLSSVYDGMIFLEPMDELEESAKVDFIYTEQFKKELARRLTIILTPGQLELSMEEANVQNLDELIEIWFGHSPRRPLAQIKELGPKDEWRSK